ncbi:MAG: PH domain-containing protein [Patescibacteria group bacterium]|nr:PH domain-containing protein [Patescibacteria group bacterium]
MGDYSSPTFASIMINLHPHPLAYFFYYLGGIVITVTSLWFGMQNILLGILIVIIAEMIRRSETYLILEESVKREFKLISTSQTSVNYEKIQDVNVSQNIIERIFKIGSVKINTAGSNRIEIEFKGVKNPYAIGDLIKEKISSKIEKTF